MRETRRGLIGSMLWISHLSDSPESASLAPGFRPKTAFEGACLVSSASWISTAQLSSAHQGRKPPPPPPADSFNITTTFGIPLARAQLYESTEHPLVKIVAASERKAGHTCREGWQTPPTLDPSTLDAVGYKIQGRATRTSAWQCFFSLFFSLTGKILSVVRISPNAMA